MSVTRRIFACLLAAMLFDACGARGSNAIGGALPQTLATPVVRNADPAELPEPPEIDAVNGVATLSLVASINPRTGFPSFLYNGLRNGAPTIRVRPGDTIVLDVANDLPHSRGRQAFRTHELNVHFHGLGVSPMPPADDVLRTLAMPGGSLHYVVPIPLDQEPGLYWYHPHVHGETNLQVGEAGMSGAIIVQGLEHHLPGLGKMKERLVIVRDTGIGSAPPVGGDDEAMPGMAGDAAMPMHGDTSVRPQDSNPNPCGPDSGRLTVTLNGAVHPDITIKPGAQEFFRLINATGHKTLKLAVDGESLQVVAIDGFALDSYRGTPPTETVPSIVVPPAGRAEFVVTGPASGRAKFRTLCFDSGPNGDPDPMTVLAHVVAPPGRSPERASRIPLTAGAPLPQNVYTNALPRPVTTRRVVFSETPNFFFINGKRFSIKGPPMFVVRTGTVEEWDVLNASREVHDFHIHQIHFAVESVNGVKIARPHWSDSVVLPHRRGIGAKGPPGEVVMLMDFRDPVIRGEFVFHCHILDHEDAGMMAKIQAI